MFTLQLVALQLHFGFTLLKIFVLPEKLVILKVTLLHKKNWAFGLRMVLDMEKWVETNMWKHKKITTGPEPFQYTYRLKAKKFSVHHVPLFRKKRFALNKMFQ